MTDAELTLLARSTLAHVMKRGADDKDRVAAARVTLEALRRPAPSSPSEDFDRMSDDELRAALGAEQGAPAGSTTQ